MDEITVFTGLGLRINALYMGFSFFLFVGSQAVDSGGAWNKFVFCAWPPVAYS
jgi:hypothetical protein